MLYYIILFWCGYTIYLALLGDLSLFPKDSFEIILPMILQFTILIAFNKIFKAKYKGTIDITTLVSCILIVLWHFNLNHGIPRKPVAMLFLVVPIFSTAHIYFMEYLEKLFLFRFGRTLEFPCY